jgi:hypothetical protein
LGDTGPVLLAFAVGLAAPAAGNALNALVASRIGRADRNRDQTDARSREAVETCYGELSALLDAIPAYAACDRRTSQQSATEADFEALARARKEHEAAVAALDANVVLLPPKVRKEMEELLEVIPYAYDLPYRSNAHHQLEQGWHPDSARTIAHNLVKHARAVLASVLTDSGIPPRPDAVEEYMIASDERNSEIEDYFSEEVGEQNETLQAWRMGHGLSPHRQALTDIT